MNYSTNVTTIGSEVFAGTSLTTIELPKVTTIPYLAFAGVTSLESISLPNVTKLEAQHSKEQQT
ncbi:leucine-rich repeat protein [Mycoplasma phocoenae]|uniref:Leucine-rich repeat protein n=1 Tax=Mycoplasma phocoenae TaxID=754517 RepID=A0A858U993_9MOLU|nr:leucine-rich repeat protein [Mycoplasma phocoenae]